MEKNVISTATATGREITIKSGNIGLLAVFLIIWLIAWTFGGIEAWKIFIKMIMNMGNSPSNAGSALFFAIWIGIWTISETGAVYVLLWGFFGKEIINVSQGVMKIRNDIAGFGWTRTFNVNLINSMRVNAAVGKKPFEVKADFRTGRKKFTGIGIINFSCSGKINRFCVSADTLDAEEVIEELKKTLPREAFEIKGAI